MSEFTPEQEKRIREIAREEGEIVLAASAGATERLFSTLDFLRIEFRLNPPLNRDDLLAAAERARDHENDDADAACIAEHGETFDAFVDRSFGGASRA